ncbi:MAG: Bro-N domain-containing protein [Candidatus Gracilibacteria bacterium]|nr:Bro-N domain-containing protein [Candidatus Gracilibacteria bacterium]
MQTTKLAIFEQKEIRKIIHENEWYFSVVDIIEVLTGSPTPRQYWGKIKEREFTNLELSPIWVQLKMKALDGKMRLTDCVNTKNAFRLIQSIPSKKAEPFKMWLAQVGKERIDEIENPELSMDRMKELYEQKGYSKDWIDKRSRSIAVRQDLTDEWKDRGVQIGREYAILTAEISKAAFGMTPSEYKNFKGLKNENLRDHMTDLELIFNMLAEASTTKIMKNKNSKGFNACKQASKQGGSIAGNARKELENKSGEKIITQQNYLEGGDKKKLK